MAQGPSSAIQLAKRFWYLVAVAVVAGIVLAVLGLSGGGSSDTTIMNNINKGGSKAPNYGHKTNIEFVIENPVRGGAWELESPVMEEFSGRGEPPANAGGWLVEGSVVRARCALRGTEYPVKIGDQHQIWEFFVELVNGGYLPTGDLRQATHDGPQGLVACESS